MKKIKAGLIGFGSIGERHYKNLIKIGCETVVLTKRKDVPTNFTPDYTEFKKRGPYQIIIVANESYLHFKTVIKVLELNPAVILVEKPLALNLSDLKTIDKAIKKGNISLIVGYSRQFYKPYQEIKKIIFSNKLGQIYFLRVSVGQHLSTWRKRNYKMSYSGNKSLGGALLFDLVHEINFPAWALNDKLVPLTAVLKKLSDLEISSEDISECVLQSRKGSVVSIHQDFLRKPARWYCEVFGSLGSLSWDSDSEKILMKVGPKTIIKNVSDDWNNMFIREMKHVIGVAEGGKFVSNIREAYADVENILKLYEIANK